MPMYNLLCLNCKNNDTYILSISEFNNIKNIKCCSCDNDNCLSLVVGSFSSRVKKRSYEVVEQAKEEADKITEKIERGDVHTIRDIFGDID